MGDLPAVLAGGLVSAVLGTLLGGGPLAAVAQEGAPEVAVRQVVEQHLDAWQRRDKAALLATLADDAILVADGWEPSVGKDAIAGFLWPALDPEVPISEFLARAQQRQEVEVEERRDAVERLEVSDRLAQVWGHSYLRMTTLRQREAGRGAVAMERTFVLMLERGAEGEWRVVYRITAAETHDILEDGQRAP